MKGQKKILNANGNQKKAGLGILSSDKTDFLFKLKNETGHYIMMKGSIQEKDIMFVNTYAPNTGTPKHI